MSILLRKLNENQVDLSDFHSEEHIGLLTVGKETKTFTIATPYSKLYDESMLMKMCEFILQNGDRNWFVVGNPGSD